MSNAEIELKLLLPGAQPATIEARLRQLGMLARRRTSTQWLWNVYHDTPDQVLRQQRQALRMRCVSERPWKNSAAAATLRGEWIQTFKSAGVSQGGLSRRGEWESRERSGRINPLALRNTPWAEIDPDGQLLGTLQPCFETRCRRTLWTLHRYQGATIEVALDIGDIIANGRSEPILELEMELKQGPPEALFHLAQVVATEVAVLPFDVSKAERGYRLAQGLVHPASAAVALHLKAGTSPLHAASQALADTFAQFTRNLSALLDTDDPEVVHQARVGWRRWRSALRLFAPWLPRQPDSGGLKPLLDALGPLRDLDVLRTDTLGRWLPAFVEGDAQRQRVADLALNGVDAARSAQRERTRAVLAMPATGLALLGLAHEVTRVTRPEEETPQGRHATWAIRRIRKLQRRLKAALDASRRPGADPERVHRARIQAKRTRYAVEMLRDLLPAKRTKALVQIATSVQTQLGEERDLQQAVRWLGALQADPALIGFLRGVLARDILADPSRHAK